MEPAHRASRHGGFRYERQERAKPASKESRAHRTLLEEAAEEGQLPQALREGAPAKPAAARAGSLRAPEASGNPAPTAFAPASPLQTERPPGLGDVTAAGHSQA